MLLLISGLIVENGVTYLKGFITKGEHICVPNLQETENSGFYSIFFLIFNCRIFFFSTQNRNMNNCE